MRDLIERQAAIEAVIYAKDDLDAERIIRRLPSAQPERKKGKWHHCEGMYTCDQCGSSLDDISPFCPMCGSDMREDQDG